jgi:hypothetical protein
MSIIYSECVSIAYLSRIQNASVLMSSVTCVVRQYFSTLSYKQRDFQEKINVKCVFNSFYVVCNSKKNSAGYCHKCTQAFI